MNGLTGLVAGVGFAVALLLGPNAGAGDELCIGTSCTTTGASDQTVDAVAGTVTTATCSVPALDVLVPGEQVCEIGSAPGGSSTTTAIGTLITTDTEGVECGAYYRDLVISLGSSQLLRWAHREC